MGFCVDEADTPHGISFEIRTQSVTFDFEGESAEISKRDLVRLKDLLNDPKWSYRLLE